MAGGYGNIRSEDGKPFQKGNKAGEKWNEEASLMLFNDLHDWMKAEDENVFIEDFLYFQCDESKYKGKIYPELMSYLSGRFTACFKLHEKAKEMQKLKLMKLGAFDKLNSSIVKFLLSAQHGMSEKTIIDQRSSDGSMSATSPKTLDDWYNEHRSKKDGK